MTVFILVFAMQLHTGEYVTRQVIEPFGDKTSCEADMKRRIDKDRQTVKKVTGACLPLSEQVNENGKPRAWL